MNYEALPAAVWESVAPHFGLAVDGAARKRMVEAARANAKAPVAKPAAFAADSADKQAAASASLRQAIDALARPNLESLRSGCTRSGRDAALPEPAASFLECEFDGVAFFRPQVRVVRFEDEDDAVPG